MSILPVDVIIDILVRLPAKSLLRFNSVCKLWYGIINDPKFIESHFQQSNNLHIIYWNTNYKMSDFDTFDNTIDLDYPIKNVGNVYVVGSCRGLLCFTMYSYPFTIFLYNPTTQKHKPLPFLPQKSIFRHKGSRYLGFGYDPVSDDYKCVRILQLKSDDEVGSFESQVMVYSLRADSWKRGAQDVPYYFDCHSGYCVDFEGILHWSVEDNNRLPLPIVSFNLNDESFSSVSLPNVDPELCMRAHIGVLDGCFCLMMNYIEHFDVWIMKEYNSPATWSKIYAFPKEMLMTVELRPLSFSTSRKQMFFTLDSYILASLDLKTSEITKVQLPDCLRVKFPHICRENLYIFKDAEDDLAGSQQRKKNSKRQKLMRRTQRFIQHYNSVLKSVMGNDADQTNQKISG